MKARTAILTAWHVHAILNAQDPTGFWVDAKKFYTAKYQGTLWQLITLTKLGADGGDERMHEAVDLLISKQDERGRWKLENCFNGRIQVDIMRNRINHTRL
jgi:hypothetical protein